jgi:hypothetical protein
MAKDLLSSDLNLHSSRAVMLSEMSWVPFYKD